MIILINGSFGVGKSTVAEGLQRKLENFVLFDPEEVGFEIKRRLGFTTDFQDFAEWRVKVVEEAKRLTQSKEISLVVPITIHKEENFDYIIEGLKGLDKEFFHYTLIAPIDVINSRLVNRGDDPNEEWFLTQVKIGIEALSAEKFKVHIDTVGRTADQIVEEIFMNIFG